MFLPQQIQLKDQINQILDLDLSNNRGNIKTINNYIKNELGRDFTYWDAKGGYDDSRTYIIYTALTKYELIKLERKIKECDFNAFMMIMSLRFILFYI